MYSRRIPAPRQWRGYLRRGHRPPGRRIPAVWQPAERSYSEMASGRHAVWMVVQIQGAREPGARRGDEMDPEGKTKQSKDVRAAGLEESIDYSSVRSIDTLSYDT